MRVVDKYELSRRIRELVWSSGMTASQIGQKIGFSNTIVYNWMDGAMPRADALLALMDLFQISPNELLMEG